MGNTILTTRPAVGAIPAQRMGSGKHAGSDKPADRTVPRPLPPRPKPARRWLAASGLPDSADAVAYLDFFYGFGAGRDVDLGLPLAYTHIPTATGCVFREDFEKGIALANCGDKPAQVTLEQPYTDSTGQPRTKVRVAPHTVVVLTG
jgi:hypothetical protein